MPGPSESADLALLSWVDLNDNGRLDIDLNGDTDGDGIIDALSLDSDGDGVSDADEGTVDANGNGIPAYRDPDEN